MRVKQGGKSEGAQSKPDNEEKKSAMQMLQQQTGTSKD